MAGHPESLFQPAEGPALAPGEAAPASSSAGAPRAPIWGWLRRISLNDWIVLAYLAMLDVSVLTSQHHGAARDRAILEVSALLFCFFTVVVVLVRGEILTHPWLRPLAFRFCHYGGIQVTYFIMRGLLPVVNPGSLDLELHQLDLRWFGVEPALALQAWVSPATTEWFAFFYYSYFIVLGMHVLPIIFFGRDSRLLSEFALGLLLVLSVGQSLYLLVPCG